MSDKKGIKYGLLHKKTGKILSYHTSSNEGYDACIDVQFILSVDGNSMWLVDDKYHAEYVRHHSTEWYNAGYDTPTNEFKPDELVVVSVEIIINTEVVEVSVPTIEEYLELNYKEKNPGHYKYCMSQLKDDRSLGYSYYDLHIMMDKKLWPPKEK